MLARMIRLAHRSARRALALISLIVLAACASVPVRMNQPLAAGPDGAPAFHANYGPRLLLSQVDSRRAARGDSDLLVFLAFSGGGTRSAAFAHGALRGLRAMPSGRGGDARASLLDDVDVISGVSGGSFTAAHYGLYREEHFETFPRDFLHRDIDIYRSQTYLQPWNWGWLVNRSVGTNDYMAEIYDRLLFHGATFGDLARRGLPLVLINATDFVNGVAFSFVDTTFGALCSDLNSFRLARAVAASSAFPFLFSPVTLENHAASCRGARPADGLPPEAAQAGDPWSRRAALARVMNAYADPNEMRWVHLLDGGLSDNLALRGILQMMLSLDDGNPVMREIALRTRRILVISIDGQSVVDRSLAQRPSFGGIRQLINASYFTLVDAYDFETLVLMNAELRTLAERFRRIRCAQGRQVRGLPCSDVRGELVYLPVARIPDPVLRERLQRTALSLTLPHADVDALVSAGEALVRDDPRIRAIVAETAAPTRQRRPGESGR